MSAPKLDLAALRAAAEPCLREPYEAHWDGPLGRSSVYVGRRGEPKSLVIRLSARQPYSSVPEARHIATATPEMVVALVDRLERAELLLANVYTEIDGSGVLTSTDDLTDEIRAHLEDR